MIGIIYKFTILSKYKKDNHKPFYIGQHWCKSVDDFLCRDYPYYGSGSIWNCLLNKLKADYSDKWRYFIKREVLCIITNNSQDTLDRLEEFWIRREKAHYSFGVGGCNILWGTANKFGSGSPAKDKLVRKKMSDAMKVRLENGWKPKNYLTEYHHKKHSDFMKRYFKTHVPHNKGKKIPKEKHPMYGKHHSAEARLKMSRNHADFSGRNNPMYGIRLCGERNPAFGKMWITNGLENLYIPKTEHIPQGYHKGLTRGLKK